MIICQNCGYQNDDDDTFCGGCPAYLPHSGVHVDETVAEEPDEVEAVAGEPAGLISRVKGMVGMEDRHDVPGDVLVEEDEDREAQEAAARAQQEADEAAAAAELAAKEAQQRREAERKAREEAAERARQEQQAREEAEAEARAQAEAERKAREEAEAQARAEAEERERQAAAEKAEAERRAQEAREAEAKAQADREARERAEAEAAAAVEAEERAAKEAEAKALREAEERAKAEAEERARAEREAEERAAAAAAERAEAQRKAEEEAARRKAEEEAAKRKAEEEARRRAEEEEKARQEAEKRAEEERKAAEQAEREAAEAAERARRAAAMVAKPAPPQPRTTRRAAAASAGVVAAGATAPTVGAGNGAPPTGAATGPTAMKPTEQRPTAPPPRPPTRKTPPTRKPEPGDQICGQCGEPNRPERKFCRRCAHTLADATVVKRPFWQRIIPRRKPKTVAAGERPGRSAKGARKVPLGRRIAKIGRMTVRWLLAAVIILGVLGALGLAGPWTDAIQSRLDGAYQSVMNRIRPTYEPANPVEAVASAQTRGAGARRVIDGFDNTHWAAGVPVTERPTLELTWAEPVDIGQVGFLAGASGDEFRELARPREVRLVFSDGSRSDLTLKDTADFQTFKVSATQARTVRVLVRSVYPAPDSDAVAITELEFFSRR